MLRVGLLHVLMADLLRRTVKPDRAHHCYDCGSCRLRLDHHCRFINNCVALGNYRFFLLFLLYGALGCLWASYRCNEAGEAGSCCHSL